VAQPEMEQLISQASGRMEIYSGGAITGSGVVPLRD
jgi:hypothetical protein